MPDVRLTRYQVMEALGQGSQGQTFRGIDRADGSEVAIKVISLRQLKDWKGFDLFERECKVLARLSHPGIPRFVDNYASEESGDYFLVMGLAPGRSLHTRQQAAESFAPKRIRSLLDQALDILGYLHEQSPPVIHRDLKPGNFVLSDEGHLTLVDFGGVRAAFRADGGSTMIGTFGFMAPEQLHGDASPATDVFALGATMVSLITGEDPEDLPRNGLAIDLEAVIPRHPLRKILEQMLVPDPQQRLPDAPAVRAALVARTAPTKPSKAQTFKSTSSLATRQDETVVIPDELRELANTQSGVFRVLLWLFASLGQGALVLSQAVLLPLVFQLSGAFGAKKDAKKREREHQQSLRSLTEHRELLRYLSEATHPLDRKAPPE